MNKLSILEVILPYFAGIFLGIAAPFGPSRWGYVGAIACFVLYAYLYITTAKKLDAPTGSAK